MASNQHHGGHSVVKIVHGTSPYRSFVEFMSRFKKNLWIICIASFLSLGIGYLAVVNLPGGFLKTPLKSKTVVRENKGPQDNKNKLRNDKKDGKAEILKLKNEQNKWRK